MMRPHALRWCLVAALAACRLPSPGLSVTEACLGPGAAAVRFDTAGLAALAGEFDVTLRDTTGTSIAGSHIGRLTLWVQDSAQQLENPWARARGTVPAPRRVLGGSFRAAAPDTGWYWTRMARTSRDFPGVIWNFRSLRFGDYDAPDVTGIDVYIEWVAQAGFVGRWTSDPGIAMAIDSQGHRIPEPGGRVCARRVGEVEE